MVTRTLRGKSNRGSALLIVAYLGVVLCGVVGIYFYRSSQAASTETRVYENASGAQNAAEYAAELAISHLRDMEYKTEKDQTKEDENALVRTSVIKDWVMRKPYGTSDAESVERRIGGTAGPHNEYEYRVVVRAVREAKEKADVVKDGWLTNINPDSYAWGTDPITKFTGAYEVVASARHIAAKKSALLAAEETVRTVVNMNYNSLLNNLGEVAVLHVEEAGKLEPGPLPASEDASEGAGGNSEGGGASGDPAAGGDDEEEGEEAGDDEAATKLKPGENYILVSGEDHYAVKATVKSTTEEVELEGLAGVPGLPSQLYSVVNTIWDAGKMTMQFRNGATPNPFIPRTALFSANAIDRQMIALRPDDAIQDEYVFGGKKIENQRNGTSNANYYSKPTGNGSNIIYGFGRSVTLLEGNLIKETNERDATPSLYAETALAVGSVENMLRFYLNFVNADHPKSDATEATVNNWKDKQWSQLPLGYHSKNKTKNGSLREYRRPLDNRASTARRRWTVLLWIKDENGRFMVREHSSWRSNSNYSSLETKTSNDPMRTSYPYPMSTWNGRYQWAMYGGYGSGSNSDGGNYHIGNFSAYNQHASTKQTIHTRILTLEELMGYQMYRDSDGIPAKVKDYDATDPNSIAPTNRDLSDSQIVAGVPDFYLVGGEKVPYEVNGCQFDEDYQRQNRSDNYGVYGKSTSYVVPTDGLYVYDPVTRQTTKYETLRDFSFKIDIAKDGDPSDIREVVTLHMVFENDAETTSTAPNMYFDIGLTVTIVYPKKTAGMSTDDDFLKEAFRHWWDGDHQEGLTGQKSHFAISAIADGIAISAAEDADKVQAYYKQFGFYDETDEEKKVEGNYTMVDTDDNMSGFPMTVLLADGSLDYDSINSEFIGSDTFYYGQDVVYEYMSIRPELYRASVFNATFQSQAELDVLIEDPDEYNRRLNLWREQKVIEYMSAQNGKTFKPLSERFSDGRVEAVLSLETPQALLLPRKEIQARRDVVHDLFGFKNITVPIAYAKWDSSRTSLQRLRYNDLADSDANDEIPLATAAKAFIPGEIVTFDSTTLYESATGIRPYLDMQYRTGSIQANGRRLKPSFVWRVADDPQNEIDLTSMHDFPKWFQGQGDEYDRAINDTDLSRKLLDENSNEHRGSLGWHREGPKWPSDPKWSGEDAERRLMYGDNYEFVIMSEKGYNPYYEMRTDSKDVIASLPPEKEEDIGLSDCEPRLKDPKDMPDFKFEGDEIDGAGILVVNGNLEVETTFAYHGVLVVLGDVRVKPREYQIFDRDGNPVDADGNVLYKDGGVWYYNDPDTGRKTRGVPLTEWRGELIVQGQALVGGRITTQIVTDDDGNEHYGKVDIRGSWQAVEETAGLWTNAAPNEGFQYDRLGWTAGTGAVGYGLWKDGD